MSAPAEQAHQEASRKLFMVVWVSLLVLTGVEVFLAYQNLEVKLMLIILMTLSISPSRPRHPHHRPARCPQ